jgi:hypothetical protein
MKKPLMLLLLCAVLAGCSGYQTGSTLPNDVQTVSLNVVNATEEPSVEVSVMRSLRAEVQMDGRLDLASASDADVLLKVTLNRFSLNPVAYDERKGSLAREYRIVLTGSMVLVRRETGEVLAESPLLLGESEFEYAADLTTAKLGSLPGAADDLARKVVSRVTTAW